MTINRLQLTIVSRLRFGDDTSCTLSSSPKEDATLSLLVECMAENGGPRDDRGVVSTKDWLKLRIRDSGLEFPLLYHTHTRTHTHTHERNFSTYKLVDILLQVHGHIEELAAHSTHLGCTGSRPSAIGPVAGMGDWSRLFLLVIPVFWVAVEVLGIGCVLHLRCLICRNRRGSFSICALTHIYTTKSI